MAYLRQAERPRLLSPPARVGDPDVRARAAELGATLDDRAVFALASEVMRSAQEISA